MDSKENEVLDIEAIKPNVQELVYYTTRFLQILTINPEFSRAKRMVVALSNFIDQRKKYYFMDKYLKLEDDELAIDNSVKKCFLQQSKEDDVNDEEEEEEESVVECSFNLDFSQSKIGRQSTPYRVLSRTNKILQLSLNTAKNDAAKETPSKSPKDKAPLPKLQSPPPKKVERERKNGIKNAPAPRRSQRIEKISGNTTANGISKANTPKKRIQSRHSIPRAAKRKSDLADVTVTNKKAKTGNLVYVDTNILKRFGLRYFEGRAKNEGKRVGKRQTRTPKEPKFRRLYDENEQLLYLMQSNITL